MAGTPYTSSKAQVARGTQFFIGGPLGTTATYVLIEEVISVTRSGAKADILDVTNMESAGYREKLPSFLDAGQVKVMFNRVSSYAGQTALTTAAGTGGAYQFKAQLPVNTAAGQVTTGDVLIFNAIISGGEEYELSFDKPVQTTITLDITGPVTLTEGS